jgi:RNA polymerase sigma-70 factor (ECF subfamily)
VSSEERNIDQALIKRAQQGDKLAFEILVIKYQHRVARVLSRLLHDPTEIEDVMQEAFIKVYRALDTFRNDSAFYTWLYRIAINTAKNHLIALKRRPHLLTGHQEQDEENPEAIINIPEINTPETELMNKQIVSTVNTAIEALPEELRTVITLREIEGLSYEEIAEVMDCPVGTVRSRIFRAREAISIELKPLLNNREKEKRW